MIFNKSLGHYCVKNILKPLYISFVLKFLILADLDHPPPHPHSPPITPTHPSCPPYHYAHAHPPVMPTCPSCPCPPPIKSNTPGWDGCIYSLTHELSNQPSHHVPNHHTPTHPMSPQTTNLMNPPTTPPPPTP